MALPVKTPSRHTPVPAHLATLDSPVRQVCVNSIVRRCIKLPWFNLFPVKSYHLICANLSPMFFKDCSKMSYSQVVSEEETVITSKKWSISRINILVHYSRTLQSGQILKAAAPSKQPLSHNLLFLSKPVYQTYLLIYVHIVTNQWWRLSPLHDFRLKLIRS